MEISQSTRVVLSAAQISTTIEDEEVILHVDSGAYFGLDGVGGRIWELLDDDPAVGEIEATIHDEFAVDREQVEIDVRAFVAELESEGLVRLVNDESDGA